VRAINFNPELPWCLLSGSWDATIKLWDVRSGTCLFTITEHAADVYGLSFHPRRPFTFLSSSRDTTLRTWSIDHLVTTLRIQLLLDPRSTKFHDSPDLAFTTKGEYRLSSPQAQTLIAKAKTRTFKDPIDEIYQLYTYMNLNEGQEELFAIMDIIKNVDYKVMREDLKVIHCG
jgi:WD40 repeat protein